MKPKDLVRSLLSPLNSCFMIHNSNSGFAFVAVIIVVVLAFSIMLVSGATDYGFSPPEGGNTSDENNGSTTPIPTISSSASQSATITLPTASN